MREVSGSIDGGEGSGWADGSLPDAEQLWQNDGCSTYCVQLGFGAHFAVDDGESWGLVSRAGEEGFKCLSKGCSTHSKRCAHVQLLRGPTQAVAGEMHGMTEEQLTRAIKEYTCEDTGKRKARCLSHRAIPDITAAGQLSDASAAAVLRKRAQGELLLPTVIETPCPTAGCACGNAAGWLERMCTCFVVGSSSVNETTYTWWVCGNARCGSVVHYDGWEDCILNACLRVKFAWETLLDYSSMCTSSPDRTFYTAR